MIKKIKCFPRILVGEKITITKSSNISQEGIVGMVIDETKNLLVLETDKGIKKLIKSSIEFVIDSNSLNIKGVTIKKKPEDRLKG